MDSILHYYPVLIPLAPLAAAIYSALPIGGAGDRKYGFGVFAHIVAFVVAVVALGEAVAAGNIARHLVICETPWSFLPTIELSIDRLSAVMMVVITSIGLVLYRYSIRYLQSERGQPRYQALLALTIATLLVMVSSCDLILLFLAWQLLSWLLCLLAYNHAHLPTARSSFRTFIMLRAGDIAFLAGIALAYQFYGTVEFSGLFEQAAQTPVKLQLFGSGLEMSGATAVALLIFIGAMSKSAQFPLHMWLPDSLFAPTPIHGLLHAGIINAGGFLLARLAPLYVLSPVALHVVFVIGLLTALLGTSMMLVQNDIKKTLGYSTIGQMGYMIMECGLGAFSLAIFHLIAHGLFKATIFLNCGNVIHETRLEPKRPSQPGDKTPLGAGNWAIGFIISLALPLLIVIGAHKLLHIPLLESQGLLIFLFFSWVTATQAMLTIYRLRGANSFKAQGLMLIAVALVTAAYLFAAEEFTSFLYPSPEVVNQYFAAAALPGPLFVAIVGITAAVIVVGWAFAYIKRQGRTVNRSRALADLRTSLYLFFMNRLYLDGVALRLRSCFKQAAETLDRSRLFLPVAILVALIAAASKLSSLADTSVETLALLILAALLLPLFPLHGLYVAFLTRLPRVGGIVLAVAMPVAGLYVLAEVSPTLSPVLGVLALIGAIYASIKAVAQSRVPHLIAYTGMAFYSILWWHIAIAGSVTADAFVYTGAVVLVIGGLLLAWDRLSVRYGDLPLNKIGGLAQPMPRFGLCLALVVMAAVGLPPFGLLFGYLGMLLNSPAPSGGLLIILLTWFAASWYLFRLMQRLLFGPHRTDLRYDDLKSGEMAAFGVVLVLLFLLTIAPHAWLNAEVNELARRIVEIP
jgi:NADH-quinone oxidoreductase subunit L